MRTKTIGFVVLVLAAGMLLQHALPTAQEASATPGLESYLGEIRMFAGTFAPRGWKMCDGQLLEIASHSALFSLMGTIYGGDGRKTFGLPDLRGRVPVGMGSGPGLTSRVQGARGGTESVDLRFNPVLVRRDIFLEESEATKTPAGYLLAPPGNRANANNLQPSTVIRFIICTDGLYPSRE